MTNLKAVLGFAVLSVVSAANGWAQAAPACLTPARAKSEASSRAGNDHHQACTAQSATLQGAISATKKAFNVLVSCAGSPFHYLVTLSQAAGDSSCTVNVSPTGAINFNAVHAAPADAPAAGATPAN